MGALIAGTPGYDDTFTQDLRLAIFAFVILAVAAVVAWALLWLAVRVGQAIARHRAGRCWHPSVVEGRRR